MAPVRSPNQNQAEFCRNPPGSGCEAIKFRTSNSAKRTPRSGTRIRLSTGHWRSLATSLSRRRYTLVIQLRAGDSARNQKTPNNFNRLLHMAQLNVRLPLSHCNLQISQRTPRLLSGTAVMPVTQAWHRSCEARLVTLSLRPTGNTSILETGCSLGKVRRHRRVARKSGGPAQFCQSDAPGRLCRTDQVWKP